MPPAGPVAGWYQNPSGPGRRYWDGERWTEHIDVSPPPAPPPAPLYVQQGAYQQPYGQPAATGGVGALVIVGYVTAILFPIVGFILGIVATTRRDEPQTSRHGPWIIVASVVAFIVWYAILASQNSGYY